MESKTDLDALFAEAVEASPLPSADLVARILADAGAAQLRLPGPRAEVRLRERGPRQRGGRQGGWTWMEELGLALGGSRGLAGLTLAGAMGLTLGLAEPASVQGLTQYLSGAAGVSAMDLLPGSGSLWTEQ